MDGLFGMKGEDWDLIAGVFAAIWILVVLIFVLSMSYYFLNNKDK